MPSVYGSDPTQLYAQGVPPLQIPLSCPILQDRACRENLTDGVHIPVQMQVHIPTEMLLQQLQGEPPSRKPTSKNTPKYPLACKRGRDGDTAEDTGKLLPNRYK